ncbi:MAG: endopeptidase La, partial [Treponema sp.]|nr:endopeptidase La [Treponema sp.]
LDVIAGLPWLEPPPEQFDLKEAQAILEEDHYGLKDVKSRIVEYLAVRKLRQGEQPRRTRTTGREDRLPTGSIICLIGPPGVGKTSVGRSIARALGKQFFRFSVGGMRDEAEIKGHRRTYIGAMPGKIIQGLKIVKSKDPVFMIDEIDKMGASFQGDPASALLEVLDPEQNFSFRDHYLDLPFDISRIFFIVTANTQDTIPPPLLDRMEIIQISGYIDTEKLEIAKRYLVPKSLEKNGLKRAQVKYSAESLLHIANGYAREAGVRNFEKNLDKIHRKLAKQIVDEDEKQRAKDPAAKPEGSAAPAAKAEGPGTAKPAAAPAAGQKADAVKPDAAETAGANPPKAVPIHPLSPYAASIKFVIEKNLVEEHLGKPLFPEGDLKRADRPGMSVGLAWTSMGGDTLVIEAISVPGKEGLTLTGKLGDTMKESATIAMMVARKLAVERFGLAADWFEKNHVHLHIPEGATPKDGPSAGITMATAFLSLLRGKIVADRLAMTGELSLTGQVLPIGGLKEKTIAARRNKARHIIIPRQNLRDLDEIPEHVKKGIEFHPVERFDEVLAIALP